MGGEPQWGADAPASRRRTAILGLAAVSVASPHEPGVGEEGDFRSESAARRPRDPGGSAAGIDCSALQDIRKRRSAHARLSPHVRDAGDHGPDAAPVVTAVCACWALPLHLAALFTLVFLEAVELLAHL